MKDLGSVIERFMVRKSLNPRSTNLSITLLRLFAAHVHLEPRKRKLPRDLIDHIYLTRVETRLELVGRHFELKHGGFPIGGIERRSLDHRSFVHLHFPAIAGEARTHLRLRFA